MIVLASTIWSGRYQRLKESILLRTLGASRAQIWKILCAEYFLLGALASATGILLAVCSSWALAKFVFKLSYAPSFAPLLVAAFAVPLLTIAIGLAASRGVGNAPPLAILRAELDCNRTASISIARQRAPMSAGQIAQAQIADADAQSVFLRRSRCRKTSGESGD